MGKFHRFTQPTYSGVPSLVSGPSYVSFNGIDYNFFNVVSGGTGSSGSAYMDGAKGSGPNTGTYGVAFGEDATSANTNRGFKALAENTDVLDDLMNRDLALPVRTALTTPLAPVATLVVPTGTFVGNSVGYPIDMLFQVTDDHDREILNSSNQAIVVTSVVGATIGTGFTTTAVTLTLSDIIPVGKTYRLYYSTRSSLASMPSDALSFINVRGAQEVAAEVEAVFSSIQAPLAQGVAWNASPKSTLWDLARSGLNERFIRKSGNANTYVPAYHPVAVGFDTEGSGGWYQRGTLSGTSPGPGITAYSAAVASSVVGTMGQADHALGGLWNVVLNDALTSSTTAHRVAISSGFVYLGGYVPGNGTTGNGSESSPGLFSFYAGARKKILGSGTKRTRLTPGSTGFIEGAQLTLDTGDYYYLTTDSNRGTIALGVDVIRVEVDGVVYSLVPVSFVDNNTANVVFLDGSVPNFGPKAAVIKTWIQTNTFFSDGGAGLYDRLRGNTVPSNGFRGFFHAAPPSDVTPTESSEEYAKFYAESVGSNFPAVAWGGYNSLNKEYSTVGYLYSNGNIGTYGDISAANGSFTGIVNCNRLDSQGITEGTSLVTFTKEVKFSSPFSVDAGDTATFNGIAQFNSTVNLASVVNFTSPSSVFFSGATTINGNLLVNAGGVGDSFQVWRDLTVHANVAATDATFTGDLSVSGDSLVRAVRPRALKVQNTATDGNIDIDVSNYPVTYWDVSAVTTGQSGLNYFQINLLNFKTGDTGRSQRAVVYLLRTSAVTGSLVSTVVFTAKDQSSTSISTSNKEVRIPVKTDEPSVTKLEFELIRLNNWVTGLDFWKVICWADHQTFELL